MPSPESLNCHLTPVQSTITAPPPPAPAPNPPLLLAPFPSRYPPPPSPLPCPAPPLPCPDPLPFVRAELWRSASVMTELLIRNGKKTDEDTSDMILLRIVNVSRTWMHTPHSLSTSPKGAISRRVAHIREREGEASSPHLRVHDQVQVPLSVPAHRNSGWKSLPTALEENLRDVNNTAKAQTHSMPSVCVAQNKVMSNLLRETTAAETVSPDRYCKTAMGRLRR
jgi:hypothetical protein